MKNNGENRSSMRSRNRSEINFKVALSCWFPLQNIQPCCDVKTVPHHQPAADAAGCASRDGLLPTWSATALCDVLSDMCQKKFNDHNLFEIFKDHSIKMITSTGIDKEAVMNQEWY